MRYRADQVPVPGGPQPSDDFVTLTVWMTLAIGIGFLIVGIRGKQRWMTFWGGFTIIACAVYFWYVVSGWPFAG